MISFDLHDIGGGFMTTPMERRLHRTLAARIEADRRRNRIGELIARIQSER